MSANRVTSVCISAHTGTAYLRFFGDLDWANWIHPSVCVVGRGMARYLLLRALAPFVVIIIVPIVGSVAFVLQYLRRQRKGTKGQEILENQQGRIWDVASSGLLEYLPLSLVLAFCFAPAVSACLFRAWQCTPYAYDEMEEHSFLAQDLSVRCDGFAEHTEILNVAWVSILTNVLELRPGLAQMSDRLAPISLAGFGGGLAHWHGPDVRFSTRPVPLHAARRPEVFASPASHGVPPPRL